MARKVTVELVDDYDGSSPAEETVAFALDGISYEIDLAQPNADKLRGALEGWISHARRVGGRATRGKRPTRSSSAARQSQVIREWARNNGVVVSDRGRIAAEVVEAYKKAHR